MAMFYAFTDGNPNGPVYEIEVNKGSIRVQQFTKTANARWANGYFIEHAFEQEGNTVVVWRKHQP
jgi:inorganic pyrophosphatase